MLTQILVHAGLAAIGAAIAWALSGVIFADREPADRPRWPIAVAIAVSVIVARPIASWIDKPTTDTVMAEIERQQPVFALLRENEPAAYERFRAMVGPMVERGRVDRDEAARQGRLIMSEVMVRRSLTANNQQIDMMLDLMIDQAAALQQEPRVCADLLVGRAGDVRRYLTDALQQREMQAYTSLLSNNAPGEPPVMSIEDAEAEMVRMLPTMAAEAGITPEAFGLAMQGQGDPVATCRAGRIFFEHIKRLEPGRRAAMYRRLMREAQAVPATPTPPR